MILAQEIVRLATKEIGVQEVNGTNSGKRVKEYQNTTDLGGTGWPWCAAFICFIVRNAMLNLNIAETAKFKRPTTASAWGFEAWSRAQDSTTNTKKPHDGDIQAGDIVVFTFSHIGVATGKPDRNGYVPTIEGNGNNQGSREGGAVVTHHRHVSKIRSRIRFRI